MTNNSMGKPFFRGSLVARGADGIVPARPAPTTTKGNRSAYGFTVGKKTGEGVPEACPWLSYGKVSISEKHLVMIRKSGKTASARLCG